MKNKVFIEVENALKSLAPQEPQGHALKRISTLSGLVSGMIDKGKSHLSKIGTGLSADINAHSQEIHAKRFLENKYTDYKVHYLPYLSHFIASFGQKKAYSANNLDLKLVIDGSQMGSKFVVLMLSLVVGKRAIPIFWLVKRGKKGHFPSDMHLEVVRQSIKMLRSFLPNQTTFTLLGDGEFDSVDLQRLCRQDLGINYVFRTASDALMSENGDKFRPKDLKLDKKTTTFFIPSIDFSKEMFEDVNFLYWFDHKIYDEPLFLISNLDNALDIIDAYKQRFAIETMFKDFKSRGFNLHKSRLQKQNAISNLIMVAALAFCFLMNFGINNQDNPLKIKVQRIDKNVNSIFSYAILLLQYVLKENLELDFYPILS